MYPHQNQRRHAKHRLESRYGITANRTLYKDLVGRVKNPNRPGGRVAWHVVVSWKNQNRSLWIVRFHDKLMPIIYDRETECVVTILPETVVQFIDARILKKAGYV